MDRVFEWTVDSASVGTSLLAFIAAQLGKGYTKKSIKEAIDANQCTVDGRSERFANTRLWNGAQVALRWKPHVLRMAPEVVYAEEDFLLINKPSGVVATADVLLPLLKLGLDWQLAHRLDKETSGLMLLVKGESVHRNVVDQFRNFQVHKRYDACVEGVLADDRGVVCNFLEVASRYSGQVIYRGSDQPTGKYAETHWEVRKRGVNATWVSCVPKTGRTHQLRVHLAEMGHPILGEAQYASKKKHSGMRLLLHATELSFLHPHCGERLRFEAPIAQDFLKTLVELGMLDDKNSDR